MKLFVLLPFLLVSVLLQAQKLPDVQQAGLRVATDIKIDGKPADWNNAFQANNSATGIFYSIANDDARLYLIIQAVDATVAKKIVGGGVTLTVNKTGEKNEKNAPAFTFPVFDLANKRFIDYRNDNSTTIKSSVVYPDSIMADNNRNLLNMSKMIRTSGVSGIDTMLSIYNDKGINAAVLFDNKMVLTLEMAIDLKLLNIAQGSAGKFLYHIQLNAVPVNNLNGVTLNSGKIQIREGAVNSREMNELSNATDFWGEYKLVQK